MYVTYMYTHTHSQTHTHTHTHTYIYIHIHTYIYIHKYICIYIYKYIYNFEILKIILSLMKELFDSEMLLNKNNKTTNVFLIMYIQWHLQ